MLEQLDMLPDVRSRPEDDTDTRFTPRTLIERLHRDFNFTVDAASCAESPAAQVIGRFWAKADDGLARSWRGERVFFNPPWSDIEPWVRRAWIGGAELAVGLLPTWTDRKWWQRLVEPFRDTGAEEWGRPKPSNDDVLSAFLDHGVRLTTLNLPRMPFGHPGNPEARGVGQPEFWCTLLFFRRGS